MAYSHCLTLLTRGETPSADATPSLEVSTGRQGRMAGFAVRFCETLRQDSDKPFDGHGAQAKMCRVKEDANSMSEFRPRLLLLGLVAVLALALIALATALASLKTQLGPPNAQASLSMPPTGGIKLVAEVNVEAAKNPYVWSATRAGSSLRLRGNVPSEDDHRTVLGMVKAHFPDLEVEDRLKIAAGAPLKEQWIGAVSFGLKQLAHLKSGSARLLNVGLRVDGEARDVSAYAEVKKALAGLLPTGLSILSDNVRPPRADPYIFMASLGADALTLSGSVPSEDALKRVREQSRRLFERPTLDDRLGLGSGAPKGWDDAVAAALQALSRLDSGDIALSGLALTIEGMAPDKGTAVVVSYQLRRDLPARFSTSESIKWKEAAVTHEIGELVIPRTKELAQTGLPPGGLASEGTVGGAR